METIKIKIKSWDDMVREFDTDEDGDIMCGYFFTKEMEGLLPDDRVIKVKKSGVNYLWYYERGRYFTITEGMVEEIL